MSLDPKRTAPAKGAPKEKPVREGQIMLRVNAEEKRQILEEAAAAGLKTSVWLRAVALGGQPPARTDLEAVRGLTKSNADLGRVGGLLKLALSGEAQEIASSPTETRKLLKEIEETQAAMRRQAEALIL